MPRRSRVSPDDLKRLLQLYGTKSPKAAYEFAETIGETPNRVRQLAWQHGVSARVGDGDRWRPPRDRDNDPRWARAISIGPISI